MKLCAHTIFSFGKRVVGSDQKKHTTVFELGSEVFEFEKKKWLESKPKDLEIRRTGLEAQTPHPETFQINFSVKNWDWRVC
jgi:hypothetical protein